MAPSRLVAAAVAAVAVLVAGCSSSESDSQPSPAATRDVADLRTVDDMRGAFAAADGSPRLLLLLSPT